jgi:hypothetical protein
VHVLKTGRIVRWNMVRTPTSYDARGANCGSAFCKPWGRHGLATIIAIWV